MKESSKIPTELGSQAVSIESAHPDDAETICDIRDTAWIAAYPNEALGITEADIRINAQGLHGEFVPRRIAYLKRQFENKNDRQQATFVAKVGGHIVGYATPQRDDKDRRMISMIYVRPDCQGRGIGSQLLEKAVDWLGRDKDIYLEVISYNQRAISFYEKFGFVKTKTVVEDEQDRPSFMKSLPQTEMVLRAMPGAL